MNRKIDVRKIGNANVNSHRRKHDIRSRDSSAKTHKARVLPTIVVVFSLLLLIGASIFYVNYKRQNNQTTIEPVVFSYASPESQGIENQTMKELFEMVQGFVEDEQIVGGELVAHARIPGQLLELDLFPPDEYGLWNLRINPSTAISFSEQDNEIISIVIHLPDGTTFTRKKLN